MKPASVGIDVAFAKAKRLPIVICTWEEGRLVPADLRDLARRFSLAPPRGSGNAATLNEQTITRFADDTATYIRAACDRLSLVPRAIAIDAPSAPRRPELRRRAAECAMDQHGISCFTTPTEEEFEGIRRKVLHHLDSGGAESRIPHSNQLWMLVGFALFRRLRDVTPCLEVYPQAIARTLRSGLIHKSKSGGIEAQLSAVSRFTGWPTGGDSRAQLRDIAFGPSHDLLDAYLSSWVAALEPENRTAFGEAPTDAIWVPKVPQESFEPTVAAAASRRVDRRGSAAPSSKRRVCPACESHEFQRWPYGWDAHAAHRCTGLVETDPEARKSEFRTRFLSARRSESSV